MKRRPVRVLRRGEAVLRGVIPLVRGRKGDDDIKCPNVEWKATRK
jgi:hypothetical protein